MLVRQFSRGDTLVALSAILQDGSGVALDLSGQTITFYMESVTTGVAKVSGAAASIVDAATGEVKYEWAAADVDTLGSYWAWFVRTLGGKRATHPIGDRLKIEIVDGPIDA